MDKFDTVIVGAGPAGLALSWHLKRLGINSMAVDRHEIGASWRRMPSDFDLITPPQASAMPGQTKLSDWHRGAMSCRQYGYLLGRYASAYDLPVLEHLQVERIEQHDNEGFAVVAGPTTLHAKTVVSATGYFQRPYLPTIPTDDSVPEFHVSCLDDAKAFAASESSVGSVVVVGRRISAGQVIVLFNRLGFEVTLSAHHPIAFQPERDLGRRLRERAYFPLEEAKAHLGLLHREDSYPMMQGGKARSLIESGVVRFVGRPRLLADRHIFGEDGSATKADLVIYATGFRPDLGFLDAHLDLNQRTGMPNDPNVTWAAERGLFFLGLDNLRTFRSRYLRGIRRDASELAVEIQAFLSTPPTTSPIPASGERRQRIGHAGKAHD